MGASVWPVTRPEMYEQLARSASLDLDARSTWVLLRLQGRPELNVSALAEHVDATPAQLARLLAPLVDAGLVTVASRDGSPLIARPTHAGHAAIDRLVSARRAGLTVLLGSWSAELDSQLSQRIAELAVDLLRDPSRREELLGVVK